MSDLGTQRRQIESSLLSCARKVDTSDKNWLDSQPFAQFIDAWHSLAHYYDWNQDTTLDAHVLKLYMRYAVLLRQTFEDTRAPQRRRQRAKAILRDLNQHLDGVFRQVERRGGARAAG
jgi:hypothetical protein